MRPTRAATSPSHPLDRPEPGWRRRVYDVVFESSTRAGRLFDIVLIGLILLSVLVVVLDSVADVHAQFGQLSWWLEWTFTVVFTIEYAARLLCVNHPIRYARSFYGVIDLLAVLPTYLAVIAPPLHSLIDVRVLRLLRIFRILKLGTYMAEFGALGEALRASWRRILVFLYVVLMVVLVAGTLMYVVEGPANGFTSIPVSVYWAITTTTTVGFGDITPKTDLGRFLASLMMLLGWGTLAVPTGIVTSEFTARRLGRGHPPRHCESCGASSVVDEARFCHQCGIALPAPTMP